MRTANESRARERAPSTARALLSTLAVLTIVLLTARPASAQDGNFGNAAFSQYLLTAGFRDSGTGAEFIHGISRTIAPGWTASYGVGLAEETSLSSSYLRFDQTLAYGTRNDRTSRDNWRHFLGVEYSPVEHFSFLGGIAKASGITGYRGASTSPTGYERLRLNAGARWVGENWGLDGSFSFIPNGASRFPGDAGYIPGLGDSDPTFFFSLTVSRRF